MKNKKLIIAIIGVLVIIILTVIMSIKIYNNQQDIIAKKYQITKESIQKKDKNLIFNGEIKNITNDQQELKCLIIEFKNNKDEIILTYQENINLDLSKNNSYPIAFSQETDINKNEIKKIQYHLCE